MSLLHVSLLVDLLRPDLTNELKSNAYCRPLAIDGSDTLELSYPGNSNLLVTEKGNFNDKVYSYLCFKVDSP